VTEKEISMPQARKPSVIFRRFLAEAHKKLDKFCANPSLSEGGFAPVADGDLNVLSNLIYTIIQSKYEEDLPINFKLVDRTKYQYMHYEPIPYRHLAKTEKDREKIFDSLMFNLNIAYGEIDNYLKIKIEEKRGKKAKQPS
jgi:hypothetical protein